MELKFIHMSDIHLFAKNYEYGDVQYNTNDLFEAAVEKFHTNHDDADFLLISGDLVDNGSVEGYEYLKSTLENRWHKPVYLCLGNHDNRENFNKVFLEKNSNSPYYYMKPLPLGETCLITLDSGKFNPWMGIIDCEQLKWLEETAANIDLPIILMLHHPPFLGVDMDSFKFQLNNSQDIYDILKCKNIVAICSGHVHGAYSYRLGQFPVFTAEGTGFGLNFAKDHSTIATDERGYNFCILNEGNVLIKRIRF